MAVTTETDRELKRLENELRRLEAEYTMFFSGRTSRPPTETRSRLAAAFRAYDRGHAHVKNTGNRFRFQTLQARFASFTDLWDRAIRAREEGRPGPLSPRVPAKEARPQEGLAGEEPRPEEGRVVHGEAFRDPALEADKLHALHASLTEARRVVGQPPVPFEKFADLVQGQVRKLQSEGVGEVAFRVSIKDGKVSFTARGVKGDAGE